MKARKENKVYEVDKTTKDRYVKSGYDIYDDEGKLIQSAKNKIVSYEEYEKVKKELEELKKVKEVTETKKIKEPTVPEIKNKLKELNIEFDDKAKKDDLLALLPQE